MSRMKSITVETGLDLYFEVYCYECGETLKIRDIEANKKGEITIGVEKHECKPEEATA